ncbi:MAG: hypothetical protein PHF63_00165 [Herbinix sp.]|nr:hypothetical protein [Herbinix sp.]
MKIKTNKEIYTGIEIADIHWGSQNPNALLFQLEESLIRFIGDLAYNKTPIDYIIICGDYFDSKLSLNSEQSKLAIRFLKSLLTIVKPYGTKTRIIKGTKSHDERQLEVLTVFENTFDFRVVNTVEKEELFPDFKVLYIPEEYMVDKDEYYKEFFNDTYDMIFGHGMFKEMGMMALTQKSEDTHSKAPVFDSKEMINICRGPIYFGHIHISQNIKDRVFYPGSFSRYCFGEESTKGFFYTIYNTKEKTFSHDLIPNINAPLYDTIEITLREGSDYDNSDIISLINSTYNNFYRDDTMKEYDHLRIRINLTNAITNPGSLISIIRETFGNIKNLKIDVKNKIKEEKDVQVENKVNELKKKYDFLFSRDFTPEEKISKYIKINFDKDITIDEIRHYINLGDI